MTYVYRIEYDEHQCGWFVFTGTDARSWHRLEVMFDTEDGARRVAEAILQETVSKPKKGTRIR